MFGRDGAASRSTKVSRSTIVDDEFGVIACRRNALARYVRLRVDENGTVFATLPKRAPLYLAKQLLESSRPEIRKLVASQRAKQSVYEDGMRIGRSHKLSMRYSDITAPKTKLHLQTLDVVMPLHYRDSHEERTYVSTQIRRALRREAMAYLPKRLRHLADTFGFDYDTVRFGNQRGRWGSCSSSGTISLNVALMNMPLDVIDYVLIHELAHTKEMNHSQNFWNLVGECLPSYREPRKLLKTMSPIC